MKSPDHYQKEARLCRRDALGLALFTAACVIALWLLGSNLKGSAFWWVPLALVTGAVTAGSGALMEIAEARKKDRLALMEDTFQPLERV